MAKSLRRNINEDRRACPADNFFNRFPFENLPGAGALPRPASMPMANALFAPDAWKGADKVITNRNTERRRSVAGFLYADDFEFSRFYPRHPGEIRLDVV